MSTPTFESEFQAMLERIASIQVTLSEMKNELAEMKLRQIELPHPFIGRFGVFYDDPQGDVCFGVCDAYDASNPNGPYSRKNGAHWRCFIALDDSLRDKIQAGD